MKTKDAFVKVEVVKPFKASRTPCPPAGVRGELYKSDDEWEYVRFALPMKDTEGVVWLSQGSDEDFMKLKFKKDEIKRVTSSAKTDNIIGYVVVGYRDHDPITCTSNGAGTPVIFPTVAEAEDDLADFQEEMTALGMDDDLFWLVEPVTEEGRDYQMAYLIKECGLR